MAAGQDQLTRSTVHRQRCSATGHDYDYTLVGGNATRNADNQCAGQVYLDLYDVLGCDEKLTAIDASLTAMVNSSGRQDWGWIDAWHMAMPPFAHLGKLRGDTQYWKTMYELHHWTRRLIVDQQGRTTGLAAEWTGLFYRDNKYVMGVAPLEGRAELGRWRIACARCGCPRWSAADRRIGHGQDRPSGPR